MPAPVALAATFSADLAQRYGQVLGRDARARDQDVIFAPMLNTVRVPQAGRNFETLGEDPFLMARLVTAETHGIQGEGEIATARGWRGCGAARWPPPAATCAGNGESRTLVALYRRLASGQGGGSAPPDPPDR